MKRLNIRRILRNPKQRRELAIRFIMSTQAQEGITTTYEQAAAAYDKVQASKQIIRGKESLKLQSIAEVRRKR